MRGPLLAALLLTGCAAESIRPPAVVAVPTMPRIAGQLEPWPEIESCGDLAGYVEKWSALLSMRDWTVTAKCEPIPESEGAAALSYSDPYGRRMEIVVDPTSEDPELLVAHELIHGLFLVTCEAKSEVTEEQIVVSLSELLRRLEKRR